MTDALLTAVQSMLVDARRVEVASRNMSQLSTPGYQREVAVVRPFGALIDAGRGVAPESVTDPAPGGLKLTGRPLDVALEGTGYFELSTAAGPVYTRAGNFSLDGSGRLVNAAGVPVAGEGGELVVRGGVASIDPQGRLLQDGKPVGRLRTVRFEHPARLARGAAGEMYARDAGLVPLAVPAAVRPGFLEGANTAAAREMVVVSEAVRHFEAAQKLYQSYDEQIRSAIQELGKF
jgi:flagellar basal-body rod protein FlgG